MRSLLPLALFLLSEIHGEQTPDASEVGEKVCIEGFIMDTFCIEQGVFLDNPLNKTLSNPELHTVHCLIDAPPCIASGYEVLLPPLSSIDPNATGNGTDLYRRGFKFDELGNNLTVALAKKTGSKELGCTTCTGEGDLVVGFRALISGTISKAAEGDVPPIVDVTEVLPASSDCPPTSAPPPPPTPSPTSFGGNIKTLNVFFRSLMVGGLGYSLLNW